MRCMAAAQVLSPLEAVGKLGQFHVRCTAEGGGHTGQAGSIRLGLSRALENFDPYMRPPLKAGEHSTVPYCAAVLLALAVCGF